MRQGFTQQLAINITPISEVAIPKEKRNHMANLMSALQYLYTHSKWSNQVESLLRNCFNNGKQSTGRSGMSLWEIFVLAQIRLCMNTSYDELLDLANFHVLVRGILGVLPNDYTQGHQYSRQNLYDNVSQIDDQTIKGINDILVAMGHEVFKKKETEALRLKTDSFVVETNTYFPTDYRLLYDSGRKCLELIGKLSTEYSFSGWRQWKSGRKKLKILYRNLGSISATGGKNKQERMHTSCQEYLEKATSLLEKVTLFLDKSMTFLPFKTSILATLVEIEWFKTMLEKHIGLVGRRLLKGEVIPHGEKLFSIFQPFTEWIRKGKLRPPVEIGKKLFVTTDQYGLMVDYQQGEHQQDSEAIIGIIDRIYEKYQSIGSWSTDKGFSTLNNKALINLVHPQIELIMPKKGKRNKDEEKQETDKSFRQLKNAHSAIESNINELEHRGLDRCPNKSVVQFSRYLGLAVTAYNLHKIGRKLISIEGQKEKKKKKFLRQAA